MGMLNGRKFRPSVFAVLLTASVVSIFCSLGMWQKGRGDERQLELSRLAQLQKIERRPLVEVLESPERYKQVVLPVSVSFDKQILLDNQIQQSRVGYFVYTPVELQTGRWVLVNRGWVVANMDRTQLPNIAMSQGEFHWSGHIDTIPRLKREISGESDVVGWPKRVPRLDKALLEQWLGVKLEDWIVRLDADQPGAYAIDWNYGGLKPEKHWSYSLQWFSLALGVFGVFLAVSFKREEQ